MDGASLNIQKDNLQKLKEIFPELFTESQLDWEKLKAAFTNDINFANERYVLNWAGKADAFRSLQIPTTATLTPVPEQSINFDTTQNIFIEGENLEVLKALQKSYYGKIKLIEIDPPYNTGSDSFIYPDKFSEKKEEYLKRVGDKDEEGYMMKEGMFHKNSKDSGHFHSNWLSMMYPRLFLAKNLLKDDGVIFVHIDDNEVHNLRLLMNEIFGEENFIAEFVWQSKKGGGSDASGAVTDHEYVLCFCKNYNESPLSRILLEAEELDEEDDYGKYRRGRELNKWGSNSRREDRPTMFFPIDGPNGDQVYPIRNDGTEGCWRLGKTKMAKIVADHNAEFVQRADGTYIVYQKIRNNDPRTKPYRTWLKDVSTTADGSKEVKDLFDGLKVFSFPKPLSLLKTLLQIGSVEEDEDIILDFFAGSGSIAQTVLELNKEEGGNRKYILVQLPETTDENSEAFKSGYKTIAEISKERVRRVIKKLNLEATQLELEIQQLNQSIEDKKALIAEEKNKTNTDLFQQEITSKKIDSYNKLIEGYEKSITDKGEQLERIKNLDKGFKVFRLSPSNFKIWQGTEITEDNLVQQLEVFTNPVSEGSQTQNMLFELILKAGYLLTDKVEEFSILIDDVDPAKRFETHFHIISDGELIIALDKINKTVIDAIIALKPKKVITLDNLFSTNDQLKTNTVLQMKDAGIDFKTI